MLPPLTELSDAERDRILDRAARELVRRRLEVPAVLALEMHRPLAYLGSQALALFTPMLAPAFGLRNLEVLYALLEDRANLDRLMERIEELAHERDAALENSPPASLEGAEGRRGEANHGRGG